MIRKMKSKIELFYDKPVRSPLTQGGLEIQCRVIANWDNNEAMDLLRTSIWERYDFEKWLEDSSKQLLAALFEELQISDTEDDKGVEEGGLQVELDTTEAAEDDQDMIMIIE